MPRGIPNDPSAARMKGGYYNTVTKDDLKQRMKEIEQRIKQLDRREKALGDLKKWLANRKLDTMDLTWMLREMKPKRADAPVKSKKPLQPGAAFEGKGKMPTKGDPAFMKAIRAARIAKNLHFEEIGLKVGVSAASVSNWEQGRYVPKEEARVKLLKFFGLPTDLGAEATARMQASFGGKSANGRAAEA